MCCLSSLLSMLSMPKCCMEQKALTSEAPQAFVHSLMRDGLFLILSERVRKNVTSRIPVSYTHLTLPTILLV